MKKWVKIAIENDDSNKILSIGADYYKEEDYENAFKYYNLAAAMGNKQAMSNLGYCYLYGRSIKKDEEMAYYYFKMSEDGCIDSIYKLGYMYENGIYVTKDLEICDYYYQRAIKIISENDLDETDYPSLFYRSALRLIDLKANNELIYNYLVIAKIGYDREINNGCTFYKEMLDDINKILNKEEFQKIKDKYDEENDDYECHCHHCDCDK